MECIYTITGVIHYSQKPSTPTSRQSISSHYFLLSQIFTQRCIKCIYNQTKSESYPLKEVFLLLPFLISILLLFNNFKFNNLQLSFITF